VTDKDRKLAKSAEKAVGIGGAVLVVVVLVAVLFFSHESDEEKAARIAEEQLQKAAEQAKTAENRRKGFHCLSSWDGSHIKLERIVKGVLNDPDSYEHIETRVAPERSGSHDFSMRFRAKNAFGAMIAGEARGIYNNSDCEPTILWAPALGIE
jgi:hypothetical protein